jgi:hypothetical protein
VQRPKKRKKNLSKIPTSQSQRRPAIAVHRGGLHKTGNGRLLAAPLISAVVSPIQMQLASSCNLNRLFCYSVLKQPQCPMPASVLGPRCKAAHFRHKCIRHEWHQVRGHCYLEIIVQQMVTTTRKSQERVLKIYFYMDNNDSHVAFTLRHFVNVRVVIINHFWCTRVLVHSSHILR